MRKLRFETVLTLIAVLAWGTAMSISDYTEDEEAIMRSQLLNSTMSEMKAIMGDDVSQFCLRGAALIVHGRYEEARQYEEDFGHCMRITVARYLAP